MTTTRTDYTAVQAAGTSRIHWAGPDLNRFGQYITVCSRGPASHRLHSAASLAEMDGVEVPEVNCTECLKRLAVELDK